MPVIAPSQTVEDAGSEMDPLSELEAFLAIVETGGLTAAARRTGTSQPAGSKAIVAPRSWNNHLQAAFAN